MKTKQSGYYYAKKRIAELEEQLARARKNVEEHIDHYHWLYDHAPFWLKWWYCKHFFGK